MQAAAHNKHSEVVVSMIEHGAPVNAAALDGTTALMMAAMANPTTTVLKTLIEHGADVNAKNNRGVTAVMMASIDPFRTDKIDLLVRSGADINAQDAAGMTALMHAFTAYTREGTSKPSFLSARTRRYKTKGDETRDSTPPRKKERNCLPCESRQSGHGTKVQGRHVGFPPISQSRCAFARRHMHRRTSFFPSGNGSFVRRTDLFSFGVEGIAKNIFPTFGN